MLRDRIITTVQFFNLQDLPLTLVELREFLVAEPEALRQGLNEQWEVENMAEAELAEHRLTNLDELLACLDAECADVIEQLDGYYFLKGRKELVEKRLENYFYGIKREKFIRRFVPFLRFLPFVRGVALAGSQALGQQKDSSDIDLFIITDPEFLWLARTLVTGYFHFLGKRRHGALIANRFCLNHYLAAPKEVQEYKNLYTASEYIKLRPLIYPETIKRFQYNNQVWIRQLFPNVDFDKPHTEKQNALQKAFEKVLANNFGLWCERKLKHMQLPKIRREEKFIVVRDDELSFHPQSKQQQLLERFFSITNEH